MLKIKWFFNRSLILIEEVREDHRSISRLVHIKDGRITIGEQEKIINPSDVIYDVGIKGKKIKEKLKTPIKKKLFGLIPYNSYNQKREIDVSKAIYTGGIPKFTFIANNTYNHDYFSEDAKFLHGKQLKNLLLMAESTTPDILRMLIKYKHIFLLLVALVVLAGAAALFGFQGYNVLSNTKLCIPP